LQVGELTCYILFFVYVFEHNKHMGELNVLKDNQVSGMCSTIADKGNT
jgi:hypothetical protein